MTEQTVEYLMELGEQLPTGELAIGISCLDVRLSGILPHATWLAPSIRYLPPGWRADRPSDLDRAIRFSEDVDPGSSYERALPANQERVLRGFGSDLEFAIAERSTEYVFLHAGVVAWEGGAIILPGPSFAGKSTLVAALLDLGAVHMSDEYAVVTGEGLILPFPRLVSLRTDIIHLAGQHDYSNFAPPKSEYGEGLPVRSIVITEYSQNSEWTCQALDRTSSLIALSVNSVSFRSRPDDTFAYLGGLLDHTVAYGGTRGDAREAARHILALG